MIKANELRKGSKFLSAFGNIETVLSIIDNTDRGKIKIVSREEIESGKFGYVSAEHLEMYESVIECYENRNQYKPCEISGIILTDELLIKMGATKEPFTFSFDISSYKKVVYKRLMIDLNQSIVCIREGQLLNNRMSDEVMVLKNNQQKGVFVHELQNIYFSIMNKELTTINLL